MKFREPKSIFNHIASRELNSFHVQKRPKMDKLLSVYNEIEAIHIFNDEFDFIPFAISFSKTSKRCYDIAVADEHGYVTLFDTRRNKTKKICEWIAHQVSSTVFFTEVYDLCWIKEDTQILTASGDKTVKVWDLQQKDCLGALRGHTDFVQSICSHPTNHDIIVSGSRDKSFRLWDLRCKSNAESGDGEISISSTAVVKRAHLYYDEEDRQVDSMGIRSVLWLKDQVSIATAGSKDSVPKFWDTRYLKQDVTYTGLLPRSTEKQRLHGLTSLSQDDHGVFLLASCKDNRIYLYNILQNKKEPLRYFEGDRISFSGKAAISPDALNIGCCSREGKVYIWQLNKPEEEPTILSPKEEESAYGFYWSGYGIKKLQFQNKVSPFAIQIRVMAMLSKE
ncbi:uncharacterized protein [Cicer arietinum]|uniref:Denticleless protein homolog isoform X1 n=1 Tax=Cicer arietinum TaxID=3827 RepID=A0A3Q7XU46_CICAR|nr:denticleless protein homolog isoform X1 [Cicer arietinum]